MAAKGCRSKNVSMFFSNSIANRKGFLPRPALFRAWTGTGEAGSSVTDTGRVATGDLGFHAYSASGATGIFAVSGSGAAANLWVNNGTFGYPKISMDLTGAYGVEHAGTEFAPIHIHIPVVLYLGNSV